MSVLNKKWKKRVRDKNCFEWAKNNGYNNFLAHLLACRYSSPDQLSKVLTSTLSDLDLPDRLPDVRKAAERIADAIQASEIIGIETDHDADGVTSHAIIHEVLTKIIGYPESQIKHYIGHRLKEGYGLSDSVVNRILADTPRPSLIVTADNGSSDEARIARLKAEGIDTIVTDHHEIPEQGIPLSAYAVISPAREDSDYPDHLIAGCYVACLTMAMVRKVLIERKYFSVEPAKITSVFDFVALGTVADCVSMSRSHNNRLIVDHGLKLINQGKRPCWRALKSYIKSGGPDPIFTAESLGFTVGPRINARGRLDDAQAGVDFLLADNDELAVQLVALLDRENTERKDIEKRLKDDALVVAEQLLAKGYETLVVYLEDGHSGVHGIVASRLTEVYGRPTIIISPKFDDDTIVSASARGVPGFHVRDALQAVDHKYPGILLKFGGHEGAAGLSLHPDNIERFRDAFEEVAAEQINEKEIELGAVLWSDGEIPVDYLRLETIDQINQMEPFGREMEPPLFESNLTIEDVKRMGELKTHIRVGFKINGQPVDGVWFNAAENKTEKELKLEKGSIQRFLFSLSKNTFRDKTTLQLMIRDVL